MSAERTLSLCLKRWIKFFKAERGLVVGICNKKKKHTGVKVHSISRKSETAGAQKETAPRN